MIVVHATFPIDPDERDRVIEHIEELEAKTRQEDGVIEYVASTDIDDPNVIRFTERYEDEQALGAHTQTDHFAEFERMLPDVLAGEPEVMRYDVENAEELEL
ncbi:antibiotic biosynthesis monooxygenase [Halovenus sp. WSH3]|uniref:Antibiotic biosynthesis monooxygenase n=1 Tax=Halovenus carboxidivorans TaxID=2692199 RepID=A0A6B0TEZ7_9EURY|nr:putative quinol monooxygenase [Halovenus carboxidivorans]MXR51759.1 antibiotic biosynthesis monooxygenase [Halovenus carboxidivorans]